MASWGKKLEGKISALTDSASRESLQTLARWMSFNRKHLEAFSNVLRDGLMTDESRQLLLIGVIHEVLLIEAENPSKWEKLIDLRTAMAEKVLLPVLDSAKLSEPAKEQLQSHIKEWDKANSFGGPSMIGLLRRKLNESSASEEQSSSSPATADDAKPAAKSAEPLAPPTPARKPVPKESLSPLRDRTPVKRQVSITTLNASYDFEGTGIPYDPNVRPQDLLEPCRQIAQLQIARDLRNDGAVQSYSLLTAMPEDVREVCAAAAEDEESTVYEIPPEQARDFSNRINEALIDMDISEQIQNVETFRNLVVSQRKQREALIKMLVQSRCQFGADEAAEAFLSADRASEELKRRKQVLIDAMELEGLEPAEEKGSGDDADEELPPLTWYKSNGEPEEKRLRVE